MIIGNDKGQEVIFYPKSATRHGLITGATGTGKTVTVKKLCEEFSKIGTPVFVTDIKGDLSGFMNPGKTSEKFESFLAERNLNAPEFTSFPMTYWDLYGENGIPLRASVSQMGPLIFSKLLNLNDTQMGVLYAIFKMADEMGLLLLDYKDISQILKFINENRAELSKTYGNLHPSTLGTIQRNLLMLEEQGLDIFLGEPAIDINDFMRTDPSGKGVINVLDARKIHTNPHLYSAFILYLLSDLLEDLPEVGDVDQPRLVFFFEEAHLLFDQATKPLLDKIQQVVKLIRSKGVGIYFITQSPRDIPDDVLAQLGNKVQHALRAYTPLEQKAIKSIADAFVTEPGQNIEEEIKTLKVGEALLSPLDESGVPTPVKRCFICPPQSDISPASSTDLESNLRSQNLLGKYKDTYDRQSAFEILREKVELAQQQQQQQEEAKKEEGSRSFLDMFTKSKSGKDTPIDRMIKSTMGSVGSTIGRTITRGILGTFLRK